MSINTPVDIAKAMENVGVVKCGLTFTKMFILAIFAGVYIGFGAIIATVATTGTAAVLGFGVSKFIGGSVFSVGLMLVVLCGAELFTGNNLISVALCSKKVTIMHVLRSWVVVYIGNLVGSLLLAFLFWATQLWGAPGSLNALGDNVVAIANAKASLDWSAVLTRGILCNILVCLAVWMSISSKEAIGKIFAIYFPIMAFVASGFEHSIANMYFIPVGLLVDGGATATLTLLGAMNNILFATIGNMIGGVIFVGILYWVVYLKPARNAACAPETK
jgi:formate/nitrite transporter